MLAEAGVLWSFSVLNRLHNHGHVNRSITSGKLEDAVELQLPQAGSQCMG